jgi:hypothetical protein
VFPGVRFKRVAQRTCNMGEKCWTKKELFAGIAHILIVSKLEDACAL